MKQSAHTRNKSTAGIKVVNGKAVFFANVEKVEVAPKDEENKELKIEEKKEQENNRWCICQ